MALFRWKITWEILNGRLKEFIKVADGKVTSKVPAKPVAGKRGKNKPKKEERGVSDMEEERRT